MDNEHTIAPPQWIKNLIIYEIATPTFTSPNGAGSGTFRSTIEKIPYLQDLGINAIWLTGHSLAHPTHFYNIWTQYAVIEPDIIDPKLGSEDDFKHLIDTCHAHDIRVILELVTHGVMSDSPLVQKHPTWFKGQSWGMQDYDFSAHNPEFDEWWVSLWTNYIIEFGIDGFRLDLGMRRPDLWHRIRENERRMGLEIVIMNESEYEETIDWCKQSGMTNIAPIEDYIAIVDFVQRDRDTLLNPHHKIAGEINEHSGRAHNWGIDEWEIWLDKVIAQPSQQGTKDWQWSTVQLSCHDDGWEDFEDTNPYVARGSRFIFGYAVLFSGLIPIFMAGEEFNAQYQALPTLSPKLFGGTNPGNGTWLYGGVVQWDLLKENKHQQMRNDVRHLIAVRKQEAKILASTPNSRQRNIRRIAYTADARCVSPYMRWSDDTLIVIAGNHYDDRTLSLTLHLPDYRLQNSEYVTITDLWTGEKNKEPRNTIDNLSITLAPDKTNQGGLAMLKIEPIL